MDLLRISRQLLNKWKNVHYSVMIIPNAGGSVKQVRIQALCIFSALFLVISAGLFFVTSSLVLIKTNFDMFRINSDITKKVTAQEGALDQLSAANTQLLEENRKLKDSTALSTEYFNRRVDEVNKLKKQVDTLLALFNKQNHADIRITTSRGSARLRMESLVPAITKASSIEDIEKMDEITLQIQKDIDTYSRLIAEVESEMKAIDCRPDLWPAQGKVTSKFGYRSDPFNRGVKPHEGIDIDNATGTPIKAAGAGVVTFSGTTSDYGIMVIISHGSGYQTVYAHLSRSDVKPGTQVKKGQLIGAMGSTGRSTGSHLHFELHINGVQTDPEDVLSSK